jgi:hypothetical protein
VTHSSRFALPFLVVAFVLAGCSPGTQGGSSSPVEASGITLVVSVPLGVGGGYGPTCGVSDFGTAYVELPGSRVTVKDQAGAVIGVGNIPASGQVKVRPNADAFFKQNCVFTLPMDVKRDAKFYTFSVGPLGDITLSQAEIAAAGWTATVGQ